MDVYTYYINEPILRHDYQFIHEQICLLNLNSEQDKPFKITEYQS